MYNFHNKIKLKVRGMKYYIKKSPESEIKFIYW